MSRGMGLRYLATCSNELRDRFSSPFRLVPARRSPPTHRRKPGRATPPFGACLKPGVSDYDCAGGGSDGPRYVGGPIRVLGDDPHGLDSDSDGYGCES